MTEKRYHHGNLKNCLIEAGIELINKEGETHFSLRKVAAICGVSNAAPYSHFSNKEELLEAMKSYVTEQFTKELNSSVKGEDLENPYTLVKLGKSYVTFFVKNPQYFEFLFSQSCISVNLSMNDDTKSSFPPFELLKEMHFRILRQHGLSDERIKDAVISAWATVHGLAAIATMKGVSYDGNWENKIEDIIWNKKEI
ncbi:TetR family transcriptional regulator [Kineothrix alysoides]|uniref:TetR family transcriptional regulator n=1 Tax=Kineothrix alysoides TaxID=1469948 RepID=A0A4R1QW30_9FIRM|nr:TetR/AcrR family transcriptional regulator [Kineothrix alysoides]TCL55234.1 TetR family transcriptional regulator [Kineothrix alysoides]